jgi:DNA-binding transcriptional regulator PaaX
MVFETPSSSNAEILSSDFKDTKDRNKRIKEISEGIVSTAVDMVLVSTYFGFEFSFAGYGRGGEAGSKAHQTLSKYNFKTIKRSFSYLRQKGLVQSMKEEMLLPKITKEGRKKIASIVPKFHSNRAWDKRVYLVTYDVPRKQNNVRNRLREFLKKIGCGMLQHSVWVTPYNPKKLIEEFIENSRLNHEIILISSLGKEGTIGDMELSELLEKVYGLSELNDRYIEYLSKVESGSVSKEEATFVFLAILKDDPQLPFELLPDDWAGNKAYRVFRKEILRQI